MEENLRKKELEELASGLRKYHYEIILREQDWMLVPKARKPRTLIIFIAFLLGFLHIARQQIIIAMLDFAFGISFMVMNYFAGQKFDLINTDIEYLLFSPDGISVQYIKDKGSLDFPKDQIQSLSVHMQYHENKSIASILLFHSHGGTLELARIMSKNENAVTTMAENIIENITSTLHLHH